MSHLCVEVSSSVRRCSRTSRQLKDVIPSLQGSREDSGRTARTCNTCETPKQRDFIQARCRIFIKEVIFSVLHHVSDQRVSNITTDCTSILHSLVFIHVKIHMPSTLTNHTQGARDRKCAEVCPGCSVNFSMLSFSSHTSQPIFLSSIWTFPYSTLPSVSNIPPSPSIRLSLHPPAHKTHLVQLWPSGFPSAERGS